MIGEYFMQKVELDNLIETLVNEHNFKTFKQHNLTIHAMDLALQLRVRDTVGRTKYFITIYIYDFSKFRDTLVDYSLEVSLNFWDRAEENPKPTLWVTMSFTNIVEVLDLSETLWIAYGRHYYDSED
jgi:hypothetical protein